MTQKQKDILLKDLCARLPYGVKGLVTFHKNMTETREEVRIIDGKLYDRFAKFQDSWYDNVTIKPYLFPLSSMTDEQCEELRNLIYEHFTLDDEFNEGICFKTYGDILVWLDEKPINQCYFIFDYFNKNHFDYRGLIEKGLAIDATGLNIY